MTDISGPIITETFEEAFPELVVDPWADIDEEFPGYRAETLADAGGDMGAELDRQAAEKLVRRVRAVEHELDESAQFIDEEITQARFQLESLIARRAEIMKPLERKKNYLQCFYPALEQWAARTLEYSKTRSIKLAYGTLRFRKNPDRLAVLDKDAAIQWALENGYTDCVKQDFAIAAAKKRLKDTGEQPDGCELVPGEDVFVVDPE